MFQSLESCGSGFVKKGPSFGRNKNFLSIRTMRWFTMRNVWRSTNCSKNGMSVLRHLPYSPDLAPNDFWAFPKMKMAMKGQHFGTVEAMKQKSADVLNRISKMFRDLETTNGTVYFCKRGVFWRGPCKTTQKINIFCCMGLGYELFGQTV